MLFLSFVSSKNLLELVPESVSLFSCHAMRHGVVLLVNSGDSKILIVIERPIHQDDSVSF